MLGGQFAPTLEGDIGISQTGIGQRIARILVDRLAEVLLSLFDTVLSEPRPVVPTFEIKLIGIGVVGVVFAQPSLLFAGHVHLQLGDHLPGDFHLERLQVGGGAVVALIPDCSVVADVDQLDAQDESVFPRGDLPGE